MRLPAMLIAPLTVLALAGCGSGSGDPTAAPSTAPSATPPTSSASTPSASPSVGSTTPISYVALGDSFTSAPGLPPVLDEACGLSGSNYPHLVAAADPAITLDDQSCTGAPSADLVNRQAEALSARTDLVTVGIGANDDNLYGIIFDQCLGLAGSDPTGAPCTAALLDTADATFGDIGASVDNDLQVIGQRAPNATVLVVGYPQPLPDSGSCPDRVPIAAGDYSFVNAMNARLNEALATAAKNHGDTFLDLAAASKGHDICAADPWINGQDVAPDGVIAYHPLAAEQEAVAAMIQARLGSVR